MGNDTLHMARHEGQTQTRGDYYTDSTHTDCTFSMVADNIPIVSHHIP